MPTLSTPSTSIFSTSLFSKISPFFLLAALLSTSACAQSVYELDDLDDGETLLNLSVSEQVEVEQDTLHANLQYVLQGRDRVALQDEINQAMTEALELLKDSDGLEYSTQQYQVYTIQNGRPNRNDIEEPVWRAQQGVRLTSKDSDVVLDMAGELQSLGFTMNGLNYSLSSEKYEEVSDSLMVAALQKLQNRANEVANALNKDEAVLLEINMNGSQGGGVFSAMPMMRMQEMNAIAAPVAEPGNTQVSLNVSARALLSSDD